MTSTHVNQGAVLNALQVRDIVGRGMVQPTYFEHFEVHFPCHYHGYLPKEKIQQLIFLSFVIRVFHKP